MSNRLVFLAGRKALQTIREEGISPDRVRVVAGAAGGPKFLVLADLDRMLFSRWFQGRTSPLFLIGASIGAWRFAAASCSNPALSLELFQDAYFHQSYSRRPGPGEVTAESNRIMDRFLSDADVKEILHHPFIRLNILAVRSLWPVSGHRQTPLLLGLTCTVMANAVRRKLVGRFFERVLFYDSRDLPPFWNPGTFPTHRIHLRKDNLRKALMASGSIPLVMNGVTGIPGAPPGVYRDAGILDYHLDIPFTGPDENGLVLFPHYTDRIIPGWLDKRFTWRKPLARHMENVLLIAPSPAFVARLPLGKIPDRNDFYGFEGRDAERKAYWQAVMDAGRYLTEEFLEMTESGKIRERVSALPTGS